ncbi:MBL fold metallo-hydrolase [Clostridia bacterium]|nr:MBL fold metallo-hydrolase [Clostridia bacterium]
MEFFVRPVGDAQANAYIVFDPAREDALVIDPGAEPELLRMALGARALAGILLTHGHGDHIGAVAALRGPQTPVYIHEADAPMLTNPNLSLSVMLGGKPSQGEPDFCFTEGELTVAGVTFTVLHTPGHTPGSVCFGCGDALFTGDTLFQAAVGRTDLPGGDTRALGRSIRRLMRLPPETRVFPGHGASTTIGAEGRYYS